MEFDKAWRASVEGGKEVIGVEEVREMLFALGYSRKDTEEEQAEIEGLWMSIKENRLEKP